MAERFAVARAALDAVREELLARDNVVACGLGYKVVGGQRTQDLAIVCSVVEKVPAAALSPASLVPPLIDGLPTDVVETGVLRALSAPTERLRPAPGGSSVGHVAITAGTLGCVVYRGDTSYILSNNHVLADSNAARMGDAIVQPGPYDGGVDPADRIATLAEFVPIRLAEPPSECAFAGAAVSAYNGLASALGSHSRLRAVSLREADNLVDAALALPVEPDSVTAEILGIGVPSGVARADIGTRVRKSGRTTGLTSGEIVQTHVTANVRFGAATARFSDQVMAGSMSAGGDSGSVAVDDDGCVVGLLFAGSETTTLFNRIEHVLAALGVTV